MYANNQCSLFMQNEGEIQISCSLISVTIEGLLRQMQLQVRKF